MSLMFIFNNVSTIFLVLWGGVAGLIVLRHLRPGVLKNVSYKWLVVIAILLHLFYGAFVTWGQYYVWANGNVFTQSFITAPLPAEAPLPNILELTRSVFEQPLGYFTYYVFGRIWLNIVILFFISGLLYSVLKLWGFYRGGFLPNGPEIILTLLLVSGYPGIFVLIPLGFFMATAWHGISYLRGSVFVGQPMYIEPAFLIATPVALYFSKAILSYL